MKMQVLGVLLDESPGTKPIKKRYYLVFPPELKLTIDEIEEMLE